MKVNFTFKNFSQEDSNSFGSNFINLVDRMRLSNYIKFVENHLNSFCIEKQNDSYLISCQNLNFSKEIPLISNDAIILVLFEMCGLKKTTVKGFTVKDPDGNKFRPEIEIFTFAKINFNCPELLNFNKNEKEISKDLRKTEIFFENEILMSLLLDSPLCFNFNEKKYWIEHENGKFYILHADKPGICSDFITDFSVNNLFLKHSSICSKYPIFNNFFNGHYENLVFNKKFYRHLLSDVKGQKDLLDFLENAPRFQDGRDRAIHELKELVIDQFPADFVQKYEYLEVFKHKKFRNKNALSLENFINP